MFFQKQICQLKFFCLFLLFLVFNKLWSLGSLKEELCPCLIQQTLCYSCNILNCINTPEFLSLFLVQVIVVWVATLLAYKLAVQSSFWCIVNDFLSNPKISSGS